MPFLIGFKGRQSEIGELTQPFHWSTGLSFLNDVIHAGAAKTPLAEDVKRKDMIGLFILGNSLRAELQRLGGHIEYYLLTVVSQRNLKD